MWLTIVSSVLAVLAAAVPPQPAGSTVAAQAECDCIHLKELQVELRNASRLQQAFRNKIAELRKLQGGESQGALKVFAEGEARRGLELIPNYKGPSQFDYSPWGENQRTFNFPNEKLCGMSESAKVELDKAVAASACAGIGTALRAHEEVHGNMCRSIGYQAYLAMHGADRAQEEVEAYGAQIKVLRALLDSLRCGYRASGRSHDTVYDGVICDLEKPFIVNGKGLANFAIKFVPSPSSPASGTASYTSSYQMVTEVGGGSYTVEGIDADKPRIVWNVSATATVLGHSVPGQNGIVYINLTSLLESGECARK